MDLRSIINTEAGGGSSALPKQTTPVTPIHPSPHPFRDSRDSINALPHASPGGKHLSQDYGSLQQQHHQHQHQNQHQHHPQQQQQAQQLQHHGSPTTYQGNYAGRPPPPTPIQAPPPHQQQQQHDSRSPARSFSGQSPYYQQHTPSSAASPLGQYPFPTSSHQQPPPAPHPHQTPQSPAHIHHQYPPPAFPPRDSYSHSAAPPYPPQRRSSLTRGSPAPQTPPIGIPGAPHPYLQHQRSQSSLSNSTPNSTQSQQTYNAMPNQDSPISTSHFPPAPIPQHQRQQSQPATPLGPPTVQRQTSGGFAQPTSPYQQRGASTGPYSQLQPPSPVPPPQVAIPRLPSTPSVFEYHTTTTSEQQRRSQSARERSLSVSPKTRLPSQPINSADLMQVEEGSSLTSAKRKMADRDVVVEHPQRVQDPLTRQQANGHEAITSASSSPRQPPKKRRTRYAEPPIWARSILSPAGRTKNLQGNGRPPRVNGKQPAAPQPAPVQQVSTEMNGVQQTARPAARTMPPEAPEADPSVILGPWEKSITGKKPFEQIAKLVADFLFVHVVSRDDLGELSSRGVVVEIEAKLGQLVDKETNERYYLPIMSECVLAEAARAGFRSSMTESQHRVLNDFLNARVAETHPPNPTSRNRLKIDYLHRRETDKFYELPPSMHTNLPAAVRALLNPRHAVKVRVTHDSKTNEVLATIIKARIRDLDIFIPQSPLDCRISINLEMRYDGDLDELIAGASSERIPDRSKDRLSYTQGLYQVDLTQVTQIMSVNGVNRTEKEHELEIELSTQAVMEQGQRAASGAPNEYLPLVEGLIDNIRVLARAVPEQ